MISCSVAIHNTNLFPMNCSVRYQSAVEPKIAPRFFGPNPCGANGGGYGEQKAAQTLGTLWIAKRQRCGRLREIRIEGGTGNVSTCSGSWHGFCGR